MECYRLLQSEQETLREDDHDDDVLKHDDFVDNLSFSFSGTAAAARKGRVVV